MKKFRYKATAAMLLISFVLSGCNVRTEEVSYQKYSEIESTPDINQTSMLDNSQLYADDDPYSITTMYLTVRKGNESDNTNHTWQEVNTYSTYYYDENNIDRYMVEATLQVGDESGPLAGQLGFSATAPNATVQVRGKTTSKSEQKSYQIKIKKDKGFWRDQRTLILNKHVYDDTRLRNKLSYDLMTGYLSLISSRTEFVHLYVQDMTDGSSGSFADYGLYTQVEQMNSRYLRNHGLDENGQLYKASMFEFMTYDDVLKLSSDPDYNLKAFEQILEVKGNNDHTKLLKMLKDLNNFSYPIEKIIDKYFDEENYLSWLAFQLSTGNTDTSSQNFLLYSPKSSERWYFISWDNDGAWDHIGRIDETGGGYNYSEGITNYWGVVLHQRVLKSETLRAKLQEKMDYFRKELSKEKLTKLVDKYKEIVKLFLFTMPDIEHANDTEKEYETDLKSMIDEIEYNYEMYMDSLTRPMPFFADIPVISENTLNFTWDNSYDFNNETLTYTFELSKDYNFKTTIENKGDIIVPNINVPMLADGQYFYRITVKNKSEKIQTAMDYYQDVNDLKHYGVMSLYIEDGKILAGS